MTVEERLREVLRARADAVVPVQPEWSRVAERLGRRRRWPRAAWLPILAAVAVFTMAVMVWVDPGSDGSRPLRTAGPPPTAAAPATPALPPLPDVQGPPAEIPDVFTGRLLPGFQPMSTTWTSSLQGWLLGEVPWCSTPPCKYLLRTTDGGNTWKGAPAPSPPGSGRSTIRFADERNGWIYGDEWALATHNGGSTWSAVNGLPGKVTSLESSEERAWAILDSAGAAAVFTSTVGTDEWRQSSGPVPAGSLVLQGSAGYVMGADGSVLALSHPGGRDRPGEPGVVERRGRPCGGGTASLAPAGSDLFALCVGLPAAGSADKTLMVSSDGGRTWSTVGNPPRGGSASGLAAASRSTIVVWAVGGASRLYRSDDGGVTWTTVYDNPNGGAFSDLGFTSASRGSVVLDSSTVGDVLMQTSDGGRTWMPLGLGPS